MRRYSRLFAVALTAAALASSGVHPSWAQTDADVVGARKLFAEGVKDEETGNFETALDAFRKVQAIKDTAGVRYRIASCLEGLGSFKEAAASYRGAIELAESDAQGADVARSSRERLASLEKRAPALTLTLSSRAPSDAVVEIDGKALAASELGRPVVLNPGNHRVTARATGAAPFETQVALPDGARFSLLVPLDQGTAPPPVVVKVEDAGPPPPPPRADGSSSAGWVLVGGGAALLVGSGVTWLVRQNAIASMKDLCPEPSCPASHRDDWTSAKSRAQLMVPLTVILAATGAAAAGTGAFLLVRSKPSDGATLRVRPTVALDTGAVFVEGSF